MAVHTLFEGLELQGYASLSTRIHADHDPFDIGVKRVYSGYGATVSPEEQLFRYSWLSPVWEGTRILNFTGSPSAEFQEMPLADRKA